MKVITRSGLLAKLGQDNVRPDIDDALEYAKTLCK